jgi:hypothetical protein
MRVGIMQPYLFPYLGHFSLIAACDRWFVFDLSQYTPKGWMNRNRVRHPNDGPNWISVPLRRSSISLRTFQAQVEDVRTAERMVLGKISHYRRYAPFARAVESLVRETFATPAQDDSLVHLDVRGLRVVCQYLGIPFEPRICSEIALDLPPRLGPGDWAREIAQQVGARAYLNPVSGRSLFDPDSFRARGIRLEFLEPRPWPYLAGPFEARGDLSILDVLMWNSPADVMQAIREHATIIPA